MIMKLSKCADIFKALANERRLRLFLMIARNCCEKSGGYDKAFTKACECLDVSKSTVSHHLKELQQSGLIICEREGQSFRCRVNEEALGLIKELLG